MGEISRRDTFESTGVMFQSEILSPGQKFGNLTHFIAPQNAIPGSGPTMVKKTESTFFGRGAGKIGEISRRDTFETTGVMFLSEILSPGQKFGNLTHFVVSQNAIPGSGRTTVKKD